MVLSQYTWMAQQKVSPQPESVQLFWVVTGQSAGPSSYMRRQVRGARPPRAQGPAYLSVAAQEQPLLLQQADEVVAQGRLEGQSQR